MKNFKDRECRQGTRAYILNLLLVHGANPNIQGLEVKHTPLHWLCYWGDHRAIEIILDFNHIGLLFAQKEEQDEYVKKYGAFNLFHTMDGATPIDIAGDLGKTKSLRAIISHFLQPKNRKVIINAFTEPWKFKKFGQ